MSGDARDWGGLRGIIDQAVEDARREAAEPPVACPNDGTPLQRHPRTGELGCPFDGWTWTPGQPHL